MNQPITAHGAWSTRRLNKYDWMAISWYINIYELMTIKICSKINNNLLSLWFSQGEKNSKHFFLLVKIKFKQLVFWEKEFKQFIFLRDFHKKKNAFFNLSNRRFFLTVKKHRTIIQHRSYYRKGGGIRWNWRFQKFSEDSPPTSFTNDYTLIGEHRLV